MANKKSKIANTATDTGQALPKTPQVKATGGSVAGELKPSTHALIMAGIAVLVFLVLKVCLNNQFTNWDDPGYIQDNTLIKNLSAAGIKAIFSEPVMGNYHPLTILSYALEYSSARLDPWLYHFDNLALHVLDTLLVYVFIFLLTRRPVAAIVTALLFGLHPMHVESVAWISGRKDVLYAFFYFSACVCYMYYLRAADGKKAGWYAGILVLFICSLLAKPVAVTLPVTLLLVDYFEKRKWEAKLLLEKAPHFILALIFGIIALKVQHTAGAMDMQKVHYNVPERIALGSYSLITYLWKAVLPISLCNFYAYPQKVGGALPVLFYLYPLAVAAIVFGAWRIGRKNRVVAFGLLFFIVNIALLLQFLQVGEAIFAERYSYIPYTGLFFIAGWYISELFSGVKKPYTNAVLGVSGIYMACLFLVSNDRCTAWYDAISLWTDAIQKDPVHDPGAYNNLGFIYYRRWATDADPYVKKRDYDSGILLLNKAIALKPEFMNPYVSLGEMERGNGQYHEARNTYFSAFKYDSKNPNMYLGLAILYYITKDTDSAAIWFRGALAVDPSPQAYGNYANFLNLTGKTDSALIEYGIAIARAPEAYASYLNRGRLLRDKGRIDEAIDDLSHAIKLNPDLGELYYERSLSYNMKGQKALALQDVDKAIAAGYDKVDNNYYNGLKQQ